MYEIHIFGLTICPDFNTKEKTGESTNFQDPEQN